MSTRPDDCPPEVMAALAEALGQASADDDVRRGLRDDLEGSLRKARVDVERVPGDALDAIRSASDEELAQLAWACRTVLIYSSKGPGGTNCFL